MFEINNDLATLKYKSWHNWFHLCASMLFVLCIYYSHDHKDILLSGLTAWAIGIFWDIGDGFKPWYYTFKHDYDQPTWLNWLRQNFLYSDKFSLQDIFVWDLGGCILGIFILTMII
jgi:hypothetical protein